MASYPGTDSSGKICYTLPPTFDGPEFLPEQRYIIAVLFDSGARAEKFINIRFEDIHLPEGKENFVKLTLKEEYSKAKGRTISLYWRHSLEAVMEYVNERIELGIKSQDPAFQGTYDAMRMFLKRVGAERLTRSVHTRLTAPKVGAVRSTDSGAAWNGFGIVLEARPNTLCCDTTNFHQEISECRRYFGKYRAYGCALNCSSAPLRCQYSLTQKCSSPLPSKSCFMKQRYWLFRRGSNFYVEDSVTGEQKSLGTADRKEAERLRAAKNEATERPALGLALGKAYLAAFDPKLVERTWSLVMNEACARGGESTKKKAAASHSQRSV